MKSVASRSSANLTKAAFKKRFYDTAFPVIVRNMPSYGDTEHSFEKFMEFYHANQADMEQDACEFNINGAVNESVKSLAGLLENWDHYKPDGNILGWLVFCGHFLPFATHLVELMFLTLTLNLSAPEGAQDHHASFATHPVLCRHFGHIPTCSTPALFHSFSTVLPHALRPSGIQELVSQLTLAKILII